MSEYAKQSPERKAQIKAAVQRSRDRLKDLTPAEQAAWKVRKSLTGEPDPYTAAERDMAVSIRQRLDAIQADAERLRENLIGRLTEEAEADADAKLILDALEQVRGVQVSIKPF
ncbi:hypothetical protein HGG70_05250 [Rhodobacteraceae bacterium R_SAG4]|nr:hypothetical protein [Rhodobacteraceae bacterium R_SAG4]